MTSSVLDAERGSAAARAARGPVASLLISVSALAALTIAIAIHQPPSIAFGAAAVTLAIGVTLQTLRMRRAREIEELYRTIVETSHDGICIIDRERRFSYVNPRYAELLGRAPSELIGATALDYVDSSDRDTVIERFARRERGEKINQTELRIRRADGGIIHVIAAVTNLVRRGRYDGILCVVTDITPRYHAEIALREAHEVLAARVAELEGETTAAAGAQIEELAARLAAANEELQTFTWSVSHDLRAPLRAVAAFARELQLDATSSLSDTGRQHLARIRASAARMGAMIDSLLDLSRASRTELRSRPGIDLSAMARAVMTELVDSDRAIDVDIAGGLTATGDPDLLRLVLQNLLGNAVKFTSKTPDARIAFGFENGAFVVRDNGAGFEPQYASKLFTPFHRLHSRSEFEGSGIGLATVRRIIQRHGGTIEADAAPGHGATFRFTLAR